MAAQLALAAAAAAMFSTPAARADIMAVAAVHRALEQAAQAQPASLSSLIRLRVLVFLPIYLLMRRL